MFGGYVKKSVGEERKRGRREEGESKIITFPEIQRQKREVVSKSLKTLKKIDSGDVGKYSMALMPFVENDANLRAINEIEKIKMKKKN